MRIVKDRAGCGRELLLAGRLQALVQLAADVLRHALARDAGDAVTAADGAPYHAIRPAHVFDVAEAIFIALERLCYVYQVHSSDLEVTEYFDNRSVSSA